jgi:pimeloyl-ACP methyl ester carboxylesterase
VDLFVRESGPAEAPTIVFLHGGRMSGWSWTPVVERMLRYRCLVPDLPQYGRSCRQGPFEIAGATDAVAELIRSRVDGPVHVVGLSLGAQVGVQLLATEPTLVDRAVLCGTMVNSLPCVRLTQRVVGRIARVSWSRRLLVRARLARPPWLSDDRIDDYHEDMRLITGRQVADIVVASAGFTFPDGLDKSDSPTLFLTGAEEIRLARRWAAALARRMPNGIDRVAIGMRHDWPLHHPDLFSRTVVGWFTDTALPPEIVAP